MLNKRNVIALATILVVVGQTGFASAQQQDQAKPAGNNAEVAQADEGNSPASYLRVSENDGVVTLDIAIAKFESGDKEKPTVTLVGVSHIGDANYYKSLQDVLDANDVVLYESVMPPGVGEFRGENDEDRIAHTKAAMTFVWSQVLAFQKREHRLPASLDELQSSVEGKDSRFDGWLNQAVIDGWGRKMVYNCDDVNSGLCPVISYGADGKEGGDGAAADILSTDPKINRDAMAQLDMADDRMQAELADALGLEFQLDVINYDHANWICADMTMDQLERAFAKRGMDFDVVGGTLAGSSLPGKMVKILLRFVSLLDSVTNGAIADTLKICLIEMLGNDQVMDQAMAQFGEGFGEIIIGERNLVTMDHLSAVLKKNDVDTIAIFYGAGHLPDFEQRLREIGYEPAGVEWKQAIAVDVKNSSMPEDQLKQMRMMIRRSMQQSFAVPGKNR